MQLLDSSACLGNDDFWPPGFRFHPTDEELILYYLKRKICRRRLKPDIVGDIDVYKWEPEELPGQSKLKTGDRQWFFFSPRDRKYPNGSRSSRATRLGYWKATGKDRTITYNSRSVGMKKTLVFYKGRAPTGERTDWVMHEYTLVEEELKRCQAVQDYYALYKVFKKSGPGPKNGEQYGAPFKEEDWEDGEHPNVNDHAFLENSVEQVNVVASVDVIIASGQVQSPSNVLEEFMNLIAEEPVFVQPPAVDFAHALHQAVGENETQSTIVDPSLREGNLPERSKVLHPTNQQHDVQASFDLTQSATSKLQVYEAPEVTSALNIYEQEPLVAEDFLEDFLEMDDLSGPEPIVQNIENPVERLQFDNIEGLSEFDLYHDAAMFLHDIVPVDLSPVYPCLNNLHNEMVNPISHSYANNLENEMANHVSHSHSNNLENDMVNPLDCELQSCSNDANGIMSNPVWMQGQQSTIFTQAESNQGTIPQSASGVVSAGNFANLPTGGNQNQSGNQNENVGVSWFSTAVWDFLESIPTTPASASESALVNRAFERMSSFGRVRVNAVPIATVRRSSKYNRGFLCFSILVVLCAILWVLIGTSVKVLGRRFFLNM
ncbi:hypothetical protein F0562_027437 [Nyssa sinensis]|uniref:NAC domain-containing protein n=1 Tax=Nyssa sinensis TaxID=561372 RepID=A0A5J5B467_9ASTE|nr:hypothetical protein F0562_027437 [Nyssa sinensis]